MNIPLVDLKAQYLSIKSEIDAAIQGVIDRVDFIQGEDVIRLEDEFAEYCGAAHAVGVSSGTEALHLALLACGIRAGDEVVTTPFTFIGTAEAITQVGATPVFVDIDPATLNIDHQKIEAAITERTRAILPVHLYGRAADMAPIQNIAARHELKVIEDAAQAHGAVYHGRRAGAIGDAGCFSFYPGKNLGAYGDAGMIVTSDSDVAGRVRLLRDHGREAKYEHLVPAFNGRLDTLQAAVVRAKLPWLEQWTERRRSLASAYRELLRDAGVGLPEADQMGCRSVYHLFVIRAPHRDLIRDELNAAGIATGIHFPIPLHMQPAYRSLGYSPGSLPESEQASREVLSLPIYPELSEEQAAEVVAVVRKAEPVAA